MTRELTVQAVTRGPQHHFFGYYDKCPWSANGKYLLAMQAPFMDRFPESEPVAIGLIDLTNDNKLTILANTHTWNWQQGAMLQWLPSSPNRDIIYNDRLQHELKSIVLDVTTGKRRVLPKPVAAVNHSGTSALSINFARLYHTRKAYGYAGVVDPWSRRLHPKDDGIYFMNLKSGHHQLIISLDQIAQFEPDTTRSGVMHWFNHLSFNTTDTRFCFLHRFEIPELKYHGTRLFTANIDGSHIRCLWSGQVSHFDWLDSRHLIAWATRQHNVININKAKAFAVRLIKKNRRLQRRLKMFPFIRKHAIQSHFLLFQDTSGATPNYAVVGENVLTEDGHCSYSPDRKWIVMDTYPDVRNYRTLLLYNVQKNKRIDICRLYSPPGLEEAVRCDLHPRWNRTGDTICIDSAHEGSRQMYIIDIGSSVDSS